MSEEIRRKRRRRPEQTIKVVDSMTQTVIGKVSDLSETGMMIVASTPIMQDALYQCELQFAASYAMGAPISVGCHELWNETSPLDGISIVGFRFIDISRADRRRIADWVNATGSRYA